MTTRREFTTMALAGAAATMLPRWAGAQGPAAVHLGVQTYSYRAMPRPAGAPDSVDVVIQAMIDSGAKECELWSPQIEPPMPMGPGTQGDPAERQAARERVRQFRLTTPLDHFTGIRKKFEARGLSIYCFNLSFNDSFTDAEIDRGFEIAKALGVGVVSVSTLLPTARRVAPFADRHKMLVSMHNHARVTDPNECATLESFDEFMKLSTYYRLNLDIGHFTAANYDSIAYIRDHHDLITHLHVKDRKKNQGDNVAWGQGDTPIAQVLKMLAARKSPIRAFIEYEYQGPGTPVEEVKKCLDIAKNMLTA
jgi:sugar phosphate isomerase/epimerase